MVYLDGGGGSGASSSTYGPSVGPSASYVAATGSSTTGGNTCASLKSALEAATAVAQACSPQISVVQCDGTQIMNDECGCPSVLLNEKKPDNVAAAKAAMAAWIQAGCGPFQCGAACFPASAGFCQPSSDATGKCAVAFPD